MKMKKVFYTLFCYLLASSLLVACSDDDDNPELTVPTEVVSEVDFLDFLWTAGKLDATVTWKEPGSVANIQKYVVYLSSDGIKKDTKLGEVTVGTTKLTISEELTLPAWIIVVAANTLGESASIAKLDISEAIGGDPSPKLRGMYVLNSGKNNSNNATLDYYNPDTKNLITKVFSTENGRGLGDTANDMIIYGSKMYIAVTNSNRIEITDLNGKSLKTVSPTDETDQPQSPRNLTAYQGKVYVTLFDGHVACIDTTTMDITGKVKVGPNPEGLAALDGLLYVANSGGYNAVQDSTISIIDVSTFTVSEKMIKTVINPFWVAIDSQGYLFSTSWGNYMDIPSTLQRINPTNGETKVIETNDQLIVTYMNHDIYFISAESNASTGWKPANMKYKIYNTVEDKIVNDNFITDGTVVENPYKLSVDPTTGNIYITTTDYVNTGDVYIFSPEGKLIHNFGTSGLNPMGAFFIIW